MCYYGVYTCGSNESFCLTECFICCLWSTRTALPIQQHNILTTIFFLSFFTVCFVWFGYFGIEFACTHVYVFINIHLFVSKMWSNIVRMHKASKFIGWNIVFFSFSSHIHSDIHRCIFFISIEYKENRFKTENPDRTFEM